MITVGRCFSHLFKEIQAGRCILPLNTASTRTISVSHMVLNVNNDKTADNFRMIYRFPYVVPAKVVCKLKLYQTGIVAVFTGVSIWSNYDVFFPLVLGSFSLVMLGVMGEFFRKLIGAVYLDSQTNQVKISHLNFFGNRTDVYVQVDDIVPVSNTNERPTDLYVKILFTDSKQKSLLLSLKYGKVIDHQAFQEVFSP